MQHPRCPSRAGAVPAPPVTPGGSGHRDFPFLTIIGKGAARPGTARALYMAFCTGAEPCQLRAAAPDVQQQLGLLRGLRAPTAQLGSVAPQPQKAQLKFPPFSNPLCGRVGFSLTWDIRMQLCCSCQNEFWCCQDYTLECDSCTLEWPPRSLWKGQQGIF